MAPADPESYYIAQKLLEHEAGGSNDPEQLVEATRRSCNRLSERFADLMGSQGVSMLMDRAVRMAKAEFPLLDNVEARPDDCLEGLREASLGRARGEALDGLVAILANFIWLLSAFIGWDLVLRLIWKIWPEVSLGEAGSGHKGGE